jgi:hypothetical protein
MKKASRLLENGPEITSGLPAGAVVMKVGSPLAVMALAIVRPPVLKPSAGPADIASAPVPAMTSPMDGVRIRDTGLLNQHGKARTARQGGGAVLSTRAIVGLQEPIMKSRYVKCLTVPPRSKSTHGMPKG